MNEVELLAAALRAANEELEVKSADLSEAVRSGRRRLIGRLIAAGVLSAVGATLLLTGGLAAPAAIRSIQQQSDNNGNDEKPNHHHEDNGGEGNGHSGGSGNGGHQHSNGGKDDSGNGDKKGSGGKREEEELPNLVVTKLTPTEVFVENLSDVSTGAFSVKVVGENAERKQVEKALRFPIGIDAGEVAASSLETEILCSGSVFAEVDYLQKVKESDEQDNELLTCTESSKDDDKSTEETKESEEGVEAPAQEETTTKSPSTANSSAETPTTP